MGWKDLAKIVGKTAPLVGSILGGPSGGVVGSLIASLLGVEDNPDAISYALQNNPDLLVKVKQMEIDREVELQRLALEDAILMVEDRKDARRRERKIVEATGEKDYNLYVLSWMIVGAFFGSIYVLGTQTIAENQALFILIGALATGFGTVIQYFFGSSKTSAEKTRMLGAQK